MTELKSLDNINEGATDAKSSQSGSAETLPDWVIEYGERKKIDERERIIERERTRRARLEAKLERLRNGEDLLGIKKRKSLGIGLSSVSIYQKFFHVCSNTQCMSHK
jgi:hypothetical protein